MIGAALGSCAHTDFSLHVARWGRFRAAIDLARRREEKSLQLRATTSLARLWRQQGRREEARPMLAGIYGWFTEGFDTADLTDARTLLEELS